MVFSELGNNEEREEKTIVVFPELIANFARVELVANVKCMIIHLKWHLPL